MSFLFRSSFALICLICAVQMAVADTDGARSLQVVERQPAAGARVALVIGNDNYTNVTALHNAVADARAIRAALEERGFQLVYRENADRRGFLAAINEFLAKLSADSVGLIYYSGHGVQIGGENFLIPVDLAAVTPNDVSIDSVNLSALLDKMASRQTAFKLAIIDACRNNPFPAATRGLGNEGGLAMKHATGVMVVYAAGSGQQALDNLGEQDHDPNGLFTREFLKAMARPALPVLDVFSATKVNVSKLARQVGHEQHPAIYDESEGEFVFTDAGGASGDQAVAPSLAAGDGDSAAPASAPATRDAGSASAPSPSAGPEVRASKVEQHFWDLIENSTEPSNFRRFLKDFPSGRHAAEARAKLEGMKAESRAATQLKSMESTTPATLSFINDTPHAVRLFWLNYDGVGVPFGVLAPGDEVVQPTYLGHIWSVRAAAPPHVLLARLVADTAEQEVHIGSSKPQSDQTLLAAQTALAQDPVLAREALESPGSDTPASIHFQNRSGREVQIFWINFEGKPEEYGDLQPGESLAQETFASHYWVVRDAAAPHPVLLRLTATAGRQDAIIEPPGGATE